MTGVQTLQTGDAPSKRAIAKAASIAFGVAMLLLFTTVLPAEYGLDPLKTGSVLGLTGIAKAGEIKGRTVVTAVSGQASVYTPQSRIYKVDSEDFSLMPNEGVEMKYHMQKGAGMVYAWKANGKLAFEFHGEPDQKPVKDYATLHLLRAHRQACHPRTSWPSRRSRRPSDETE